MRARVFIAALVTACTTSAACLTVGAVVPGTALSATAAGATTSDEAALLALTNQARAAVGASALRLDAGLTSVARSWASTMAARGGISHNPDLGSLLVGWLRLGENVGVGSSIAQIHDALLNSPSHYKNLSNPAFSLVGIGVVSSGGRLYVVENFETPAEGGEPDAVADPEPPTADAPGDETTTTPPASAAPTESGQPLPEPVTAPSSGITTPPFVLNAVRALDSGSQLGTAVGRGIEAAQD